MRVLDKITFVLNIVLGILYVPLSGFSLLLLMASEGNEGKSEWFHMLLKVFGYSVISIPLYCILAIVLSVIFRKKGKSLLAFLIQFLPILVFALNLIFLKYLGNVQ